jgi:integrase
MATIRKRGIAWQAQVFLKGIRQSSTHSSKLEAQQWAAKTESEIIAGKKEIVADKTFGDLLTKYRDEVSPTKDGERWERLRINKYLGDQIAEVHLRDLNKSHFAKWRDDRMKVVEAGTVLREWNLLSNALKRARDEWGWMTDNPLKPVSKPKKPPPRTRIATAGEVEAMLHCAGYRKDVALDTATLRVFAGLLSPTEN